MNTLVLYSPFGEEDYKALPLVLFSKKQGGKGQKIRVLENIMIEVSYLEVVLQLFLPPPPLNDTYVCV